MSYFESPSRKVNANVYINNADHPDDVRNINFRIEVNENADRLLPGCAAQAEVDIEVLREIEENLAGQEVDIRFNALDTNVGGDAETATFATNLIIVGQECVKGSGITRIRAADIMSILDKTDYISTLEYPTNTIAMAYEIARLTGVTIYWGSPGSLSSPAELPVNEKPVGYTCREVLAFIAGMYGRYAMDAIWASTDNRFYVNSVVLRPYRHDYFTIPASLIHQGGFDLKTDEPLAPDPIVYVESKVTVTDPTPSSAPEGAVFDDLRYLQNPDELAGLEVYENYLAGYGPYWVIFKWLGKDSEGNATSPYFVLFYSEPTTFVWETEDHGISDVWYTTYRFKNVDPVATGMYKTNFTRGQMYNDAITDTLFDFPTSKSNASSYTYMGADYPTGIVSFAYEHGNWYPDGYQNWEIVAANFNVMLDDGTLILAKNDRLVGSLRNTPSKGGVSVEYGSGDYTNPLIDEGNVSDVQLKQSYYFYWPGTLKWRGHPHVRPGTIVSVTDRDGNSFQFLISALELHYDGGMYMVAESHGSPDTFATLSGLQREMKKIRGLRALWKTKNTEEAAT